MGILLMNVFKYIRGYAELREVRDEISEAIEIVFFFSKPNILHTHNLI